MTADDDTEPLPLSAWSGGARWTTGIDLVPIDRMRRLLTGDAARVGLFRPGEIEYCAGGAGSAAHFAARLAAKEATLKALGVGLGVPAALNRLRAIEVCQTGAEPRLRLHGALAAYARRTGLLGGALSMTHAAGLAMAHVVVGWAAPTGATDVSPVAERRSDAEREARHAVRC